MKWMWRILVLPYFLCMCVVYMASAVFFILPKWLRYQVEDGVAEAWKWWADVVWRMIDRGPIEPKGGAK
jgi:hypothetical protein